MTRSCAVLIPSGNVLLAILIGLSFCLDATALSHAQEPTANGREPERWAVILVGLPGDVEHETAFRKTADQIQKWLTESQRIPADHVLRLPGEPKDGEESAAPLTADSMRTMFADVNSRLLADDALWVFTLGHGSYDGRRAWFHVAGKDPSSEDFGRWLVDVPCREQIIWLTHSSSGWFVKPLARPGRIVIAATAADDESNETEFPRAFATVSGFSVSKLDGDQDKAVSVAELYSAVVNEVTRRFRSDNRLPTEHAQLDDNGDGIGTEDIQQPESDAPSAAVPPAPASKIDGDLARTTFIPYPEVKRADDEPPPAE